MAKIRVLMVDDHTLLREGLRALLDNYDDIEVVGDARDGEEALMRVGELVPDVVLMDIMMQGMNGLEATRRIHQRYPQVRVLVLTQHDEHQLVFSLLQAGAAGYVLKRALGTDLVNALRSVYYGRSFLDPDVAKIIVNQVWQAGENEKGSGEPLTPRECEVLKHIALGKTNAQIASALSLSTNTVVWHRANLMSKLGIHKATELVRYAIQSGLITQGDREEGG